MMVSDMTLEVIWSRIFVLLDWAERAYVAWSGVHKAMSVAVSMVKDQCVLKDNLPDHLILSLEALPTVEPAF
jgi:hypothetical protein